MVVTSSLQPASLSLSITNDEIKRFNGGDEVTLTCQTHTGKTKSYKISFVNNEFRIRSTALLASIRPYYTTLQSQQSKDLFAQKALMQFVCLPSIATDKILGTLLNRSIPKDVRSTIYARLSEAVRLQIMKQLTAQFSNDNTALSTTICALPLNASAALIEMFMNEQLTSQAENEEEKQQILLAIFTHPDWDGGDRLHLVVCLSKKIQTSLMNSLVDEVMMNVLAPNSIATDHLSFTEQQLENYLTMVATLCPETLHTVADRLPKELFLPLCCIIRQAISAAILKTMDPIKAKDMICTFVQYQLEAVTHYSQAHHVAIANENWVDIDENGLTSQQDFNPIETDGWDLTFLPTAHLSIFQKKDFNSLLPSILENMIHDDIALMINSMTAFEKSTFFTYAFKYKEKWLTIYIQKIGLTDFQTLLSTFDWSLKLQLLVIIFETPDTTITLEQLLEKSLNCNGCQLLELSLKISNIPAMHLLFNMDVSDQQRCLAHPDFKHKRDWLMNAVVATAKCQEQEPNTFHCIKLWMSNSSPEFLTILCTKTLPEPLIAIFALIPDQTIRYLVPSLGFSIATAGAKTLAQKYTFLPPQKVITLLRLQSDYSEVLEHYLSCTSGNKRLDTINYLIANQSVLTIRLTHNLVDLYIRETALTLAKAPYLQRQSFNRKLSHQQWHKLVINANACDRGKMIDFNNGRQVTLWLAQGNQHELITATLQHIEIEQSHRLFEHIPLPQLAMALLLIDPQRACCIIQQSCDHFNLAKTILIMYQSSSCQSTFILNRLNNTKVKAQLLGALESSNSEKEIAQILFKLSPVMNNAALKIQQTYATHKQLLAQQLLEPFTFYQLIHKDKKSQTETPYYFTQHHLLPPLRRPVGDACVEADIGRNKALKSMDDDYVEFNMSPSALTNTNLSRQPGTTLSDKRNHFLFQLFTEIRAALKGDIEAHSTMQIAMQGFTTQRGTFVAVNGGINLNSYLAPKSSAHQTISIETFRPACRCLELLHNKRIYLRDIKPSNFLYKANANRHNSVPVSPQLQYIDLDETLTPSLGHSETEAFTPAYCTSELYNSENCYQQRDQYAFLLTVIFAVSEPSRTLSWENHNSSDFMFEKGILHSSRTNPQQKKVLNSFIDQYIQLQYRTSVQNFLMDPVNYPLPATLTELIDWESDINKEKQQNPFTPIPIQ